jgi:3-oxoadipate enol-lactonase
MLDPLLAAAPAGARWIVYDHPGVGRSERRGGPFTTGGLAAAAVRVLDELGLASAHIAGISLGGAIAIELALETPRRARSLVLLGTTAAGPLRRHLDVAALTVTNARILAGSIVRRRLWLDPALYSREHQRRRQRRRPRSAAAPPADYGASAAALLGQAVAASLHDRSARLREIDIPTLIIHGERDVLVPVANARAVAAGVRGATLRIFPGTGHAFMLERPAEVAALLTDWAQQTRPASA